MRSSILYLVLATLALCLSCSNPVTVATCWQVTEIGFTASKNYEAGGGDRVQMDVQFVHSPGGESLTVPAFWDGGSSFLVRFAPTLPGKWSYHTSCPDDAALDGLQGSLRCRPYTGEQEIYRRGFVKAQDGTKYLMYADGTPFFYLGDTHWGLLTEALTEDHLLHILKRRVEQGFTVLQSEPIGGHFNLADGSVDASDIEGLREADAYFQAIASAGLVHANAEFFFPSEMTAALAADDAALKALSRYWVARFGAYPVLWTLAQEIDNDFYSEKDHHFYDYTSNPWIKIAQYLHEADAYDHPLSAHQENTVMTSVTGAGTEIDPQKTSGASIFRDQEIAAKTGHNWWAVQWSPPLAQTPDPATIQDYWFSTRPAVNYEGRYCGLWTGNYGARAQGWISFLSGFCGYGYGAIDIWLFNSTYDMHSTTFDGVEHITPEIKATSWKESLEYPSALQMKHLRSFMDDFDWWNLVPVIPGDPSLKDASGAAVYAHTAGRHVLYFYGGSTTTGRLFSLPPEASPKARWYNPRSGEFVETSVSLPQPDGYRDLPSKPDTQDWVLVIDL